MWDVFPPIRRLALSLLRIYVVILVLVLCFQRKLLFFPSCSDEPRMIDDAARAGLQPWRDAGGTLIGWRCGKDGANKLLVFHGNAGNAVNRSYYANGFCPLGGGRQWDVWICEYPGYGSRPGSPTREAFAEAAESAAAQLAAMDPRPLFVLGESIGSGVACDLAASEPKLVRGLILVTPFARLADVGAAKFPFLPVKYLLRDRWDNVAALAQYRMPVAALIAGRDEVVGTRQGELLFEKIAGKKKRWDFPEATHNSEEISDVTQWAAEVSDFLLKR